MNSASMFRSWKKRNKQGRPQLTVERCTFLIGVTAVGKELERRHEMGGELGGRRFGSGGGRCFAERERR